MEKYEPMASTAGQLDLSITIGDASFSARGDTSTVLDAYGDFKTLIAAGGSQASSSRARTRDDLVRKPENSPSSAKRTTSLPLKPFLQQYKLQTNKEKATAILAWASESGEQSALTASEVEKLWKKTPFKAPGNLTRDLRSAESEGWLDSAGKAGSPEATFSINGYGEGIIASWAKDDEKA